MKHIIHLVSRVTCAIAACYLLTACGAGSSDTTSAPSASGQPPAAQSTPAVPSSGTTPAMTTTAQSPSAAQLPSAPPPPARTRELTDPDNETMMWIAYDWMGVQPPLQAWAEQTVTREQNQYSSSINEFNRKDRLQALVTELGQRFESARGVGVLQLTLSGNLSQYDPTYGEFYISSFSPGSYLTYTEDKQKILVKFTNATAAYIWKVPPEEAERVVQRMGQARGVTITARLRIVSAAPGGDGGTLQTQVLSYDMQTSNRMGGNVPLASVTVTQ